MIIDSHVHIGTTDHIKASVVDLITEMDLAKVDKAIVYACNFADISNEKLIEEISKYVSLKDRLYGVLAYHPSTFIETIASKLNNPQIVGIKFYLGYDHWYPNDERIYEVLKLCYKYKKTAIFHCGDCLNSVCRAKLKYAHPLNIDEVAVDFPDVKMVIAHMGNPWIRDTAEVCYKNDNVYTDISGFVYGKFSLADMANFKTNLKEYLRIAPPDKLLFGSDYPISDMSSYHAIVDVVLENTSIYNNVFKAFNLK